MPARRQVHQEVALERCSWPSRGGFEDVVSSPLSFCSQLIRELTVTVNYNSAPSTSRPRALVLVLLVLREGLVLRLSSHVHDGDSRRLSRHARHVEGEERKRRYGGEEHEAGGGDECPAVCVFGEQQDLERALADVFIKKESPRSS